MAMRRRTVTGVALAVAIAAAVVGAGGVGVGGVGAAAPRGGPPTPDEVAATQRTLDARAASVPASVVSWGVDPALGLVVVEVTGGRDATVEEFLAGVDPRTYRVETGTPAARPFPATTPRTTPGTTPGS